MKPLRLHSPAIVSCAGTGLDATLAAIRSGHSGLLPCRFETVDLPTHAGEVAALADVRLDAAHAAFDCRNNRLAEIALGQDGFEDAVRALVARHGASRIGLFVGTSTSGILQAERLAVVGYRVSEIRPDTPQLYSVRAGLREEINKFADQVSTVGMTRLALVYEESAGAPALLAVAQEAAARSKASLTKASYPAGTARMAAAVATMQAASPQAIFIVGSGTVVAGFIEQYRGGGGAAQLFAPSGADIEQMSKRLGDEQMQGVSIAQVTPNPYQVRTRLAKELSDALSATTGVDVPVSYTMMEGFIACKVIVEAVRRQGVRVTREGMAPALDSMNGYDLGGYIVSYKPGSRTGSRLVELTIITARGKIRQ